MAVVFALRLVRLQFHGRTGVVTFLANQMQVMGVNTLTPA